MEPGIPGWDLPDPQLMIVLLLAIGLALVHWNRLPRGIRELPKAIAGFVLIASVVGFILLLLRGA